MSNEPSSFWSYTRSERGGIMFLLVVCALCYLAPRWLPTPTAAPTDEVLRAALNNLKQYEADVATTDEPFAVSDEIGLRSINPNTVDRNVLEALGLPPRTVRAWSNFINKGGTFRNEAALARFRALSGEDRARILPYLTFSAPANLQRRPAYADRYPARQRAGHLTQFDPNKATADELEALGLSPRIANNIVKYREKGGQFRRPDDLARIYGIDAETFQRLRPYIQIEESPTAVLAQMGEDEERPTSYEAARTLTIDINQATAAEWQRLRGIGPALSARIIKFRDALGGFHSVAQVGETYGLPDSTFQRIRLQLRPSPILQQISVNQASEQQLSQHPLLRAHARALVRYREQHGPYQSADDLLKLRTLDPATVQRLAPYLSFD